MFLQVCVVRSGHSRDVLLMKAGGSMEMKEFFFTRVPFESALLNLAAHEPQYHLRKNYQNKGKHKADISSKSNSAGNFNKHFIGICLNAQDYHRLTLFSRTLLAFCYFLGYNFSLYV